RVSSAQPVLAVRASEPDARAAKREAPASVESVVFASPIASTTPPRRARTRVVTEYDGFFELDEDVLERGSAWMGPRARVRLRDLESARTIEIELELEPLWHLRAYGAGELELVLALDELELGSFVLGTKGTHRISVDLPRSTRRDGDLHLTASRF